MREKEENGNKIEARQRRGSGRVEAAGGEETKEGEEAGDERGESRGGKRGIKEGGKGGEAGWIRAAHPRVQVGEVEPCTSALQHASPSAAGCPQALSVNSKDNEACF